MASEHDGPEDADDVELEDELETRIMEPLHIQVKDVRLVDPLTDTPFDLTDPGGSPPPERPDPRDEPLPELPPPPIAPDSPFGLVAEDEVATVVGSLDMFAAPVDLALEEESLEQTFVGPLPTPPDEELTALSLPTVELAKAEEPWRRLHPASLYINLLPQTYRTLRGLWPLLLLMLFGGQGSGTAGFDLTYLLVFFAISISRTVVHFLTLRYRLNAGKLEVRSGLLNRRSRVLDPYRIQNMELAQNPLHKLAGLVELRVETAGDASTEGMLSALSVGEAQRLKGALERLARARRRQQGLDDGADDSAEGRELLKTDVLELVAYGLSQRRVGTVALLFAAGMEVMSLLDPYQTQQVASELSTARLLGAVLLAFAGTWIFSAGQALLRHYGFTLTVRGDRLVTQEGLLTRRSVEIPRGKVQLVRVDEPWLRRQMGYGTTLIETAALGMADGEVRQAEGVIPMAPQESFAELTREASPALASDPWNVTLRPAHPRALYRLIIGQLVRSFFLGGVAVWLLPWPWGLVVAAALLPLGVLLAWLDWRNQGWLVTPQVVIARRGYLTRRTWVIARSKIQSVHMGQSPLMRWHGLAGVNVAVAGSRVRLPDVGLDIGQQILDDLRWTWWQSADEADPGSEGPTVLQR